MNPFPLVMVSGQVLQDRDKADEQLCRLTNKEALKRNQNVYGGHLDLELSTPPPVQVSQVLCVARVPRMFNFDAPD